MHSIFSFSYCVIVFFTVAYTQYHPKSNKESFIALYHRIWGSIFCQGQIPGLQVCFPSPVLAHAEGNQSMCLSHISNFSNTLSFLPFHCLWKAMKKKKRKELFTAFGSHKSLVFFHLELIILSLTFKEVLSLYHYYTLNLQTCNKQYKPNLCTAIFDLTFLGNSIVNPWPQLL